VIDNAGSYRPGADYQGLGMKLVDKRVKNSFGPDYGLEMVCEPDRETHARVKLPLPQDKQDDSCVNH